MQSTTLCFLVREGEVLLAMKKRGFGAGKWNGVGGKVKEGEDVENAAAREIEEEIGVRVAPTALKNRGEIRFSFKDHPQWDQMMSVFVANSWDGDPVETGEMRPKWYPQSELPFKDMWVDDPHWVPLVLSGKKIAAEFLFGGEGETLLDFSVNEVSGVNV